MTSCTAMFVQSVAKIKQQPKTRTRKQLALIDVAVDEAQRRARTGDWEDAKAATFVGLYALCHRLVYGVLPSELVAAGTFKLAVRMAAKAKHELFHDDGIALVEFVRWTWEREKRKNSWAQSKSVDRNRMSWKWQFSRAMETDYRIHLSQKR